MRSSIRSGKSIFLGIFVHFRCRLTSGRGISAVEGSTVLPVGSLMGTKRGSLMKEVGHTLYLELFIPTKSQKFNEVCVNITNKIRHNLRCKSTHFRNDCFVNIKNLQVNWFRSFFFFFFSFFLLLYFCICSHKNQPQARQYIYKSSGAGCHKRRHFPLRKENTAAKGEPVKVLTHTKIFRNIKNIKKRK